MVTGELKGDFHVHVHYYEEGNVALKHDQSTSVTLEVGDDAPEQVAEQVLQQIKKSELAFQTSLNASYRHVSETAFKALRRNLPVFRTKIDWDKISTYKIGSKIASKQQEE
jgi:capping protein alpha